jgi:hypothetical protein
MIGHLRSKPRNVGILECITSLEWTVAEKMGLSFEGPNRERIPRAGALMDIGTERFLLGPVAQVVRAHA